MAKKFSIKVGTVVWVKVLKKYNIRGTVVEIKDNVAKIEVPTYYGSTQPLIVYKDVDLLIDNLVFDSLKKMEDFKEFKKISKGC